MENKQIHIASAGRRLIAALTDCAIGCLLCLSFLFFVVSAKDLSTLLSSLLQLLLVAIFVPTFLFFINLFLISRFGGTIGKLLTGIAIVGKDKKYISFWRALFRNAIGYMVSGIFLDIGFIWIFFDKERRGWHDMMANTTVVVTKKIGATTGMIALVVVFGVNIFLGTQIFKQVKQNLPLYQEMIKDARGESEKSIVENYEITT